uniref:Factor of DNA methylation 1-5/IDN2 domain-containing protein n=1 Tax=Leersia perrieri TaxID=77586 RepID=A0A0D9UWP7_9ORYZ
MADAETPNAAAAAGGGGGGELLVWPWTGILATATTTNTSADAVNTLSVHAEHHFAGVPTTALHETAAGDDGDGHHHHHFLLLHFGKSWSGLRHAISLRARFAGAGRREWLRRRRRPIAGVVHGWPAGEDDLRAGDGGAVVGRFLREAGGEARSAEGVEREEMRVAAKLGAIAGELERRVEFLEAKCEEIAGAAKKTAAYSDWLNGELQEEDLEISSLRLPSREYKCDDAQTLHENHKQEMEAIYAKLHQLEKQLKQRQALEFTVQQLNKKIQAGESLTKEDHEHIYNIMVCLRTIVDEEQEMLVDSCAELMKRLRTNCDELQEYRQELMKGFENTTITGHTIIGIKRMGELDERPFHLACKRKHRDNDSEGKAARLITYWQKEMKKPSWHPFTTIQVDGEDKEVVDENDPKLRQLCIDYGDSVCNAVKSAMAELNEYNSRGRCAKNELWNFREGRKATTREVVKYISDQLKFNKQ